MSNSSLNDGLYAEMNTSKGKILLQLEFEKTPLTVGNFVGLAEGTKDFDTSSRTPGQPYYDGLTFHRVIPDFMIQGGCPDGVGSGGPGYEFEDEIDASLKHDGPGILSMANAGLGTPVHHYGMVDRGDSWDGNLLHRPIFQPLRCLVASGQRPAATVALAEADEGVQGSR